MQLIGINQFPHIIAFTQKYASNKDQDLSECFITSVFLRYKMIVFPFVVQEELITSSFRKILGWSILIQSFAPLCSCYEPQAECLEPNGMAAEKKRALSVRKIWQHATILEGQSWALDCFCHCDVFLTIN